MCDQCYSTKPNLPARNFEDEVKVWHLGHKEPHPKCPICQKRD